MPRKHRYKHTFSKEVSSKLMKELMKVEPPKKPRTDMLRSANHVSEQLIHKPYQNKNIEILLDVTGDHLWIYDHDHQVSHSFARDISHQYTSQGSIIPVYKELKDTLRAFLKENYKVDNPDLILADGNIEYDCTNGAFFDAEKSVDKTDYIPCLLTANEVVISADAVENIGNGNARNGGQALMMLNTIASAKKKMNEGTING
jgi:hypothetical protein